MSDYATKLTSIVDKLIVVIQEQHERDCYNNMINDFLKTRVVHCQEEYYDVYIGRGKCPQTLEESKWGNPFTHIKDKKTKAEFVVETREEALAKYKQWLLAQPVLMDSLHELVGKTLGCWCKPDSCHGDVLIEVIKVKYKFGDTNV